MIVAPIPSRESARLDALHRSRILDTPTEPAFDELARLAAYVCRTPMAVISLVDSTRQWFKSVVGLPYAGSPRSTAFCAHTILGTDLFIVEEADADERFADHPWVVELPSIRFYAGVPLMTPDGYAIGSLAVMDVVPRSLTPEQRAAMQTLAKQVMAQMELRRAPRPDIRQEQVRRKETEDLSQALLDRIARHAGPASVPALCEDSTAQNKAEELVRESELKFRSIFEQAPVGIATIDSRTGRFKSVNSSYCRIMGYTGEEMLSRTFLDITHPDDLQADLDQMKRLLDGDIATFEMDKRLVRKNGDAIWVHLTCVPLWQRPSDPRVHLALVQDISERKRAEERTRHFQNELEQLVESRTTDLQRTHRLLQSVIDSSPDWIFVKDREHRFVLVNKAFAASQQLTPADMAGRWDSDFWSHELCEGDAAKGIRGFHMDDRRAFAGELIHNPYDPASLHDGTLRIFDTYKGPWHDPNGQIGGVLCYARDVTEQRRAEEIVRQLNSDLAIRVDERTAELARANRLLEADIVERKQAEARLLESHQFMASILDYLPVTVFVKDAATLRYAHFNRAGETLTGFSKEEVLGKTDHDLFPSDVADSFVARDRATIDARRIVDIPEEKVLTSDHDTRILHTKKVAILDADGRPRYLLGVAEDITERKRAEGEQAKQDMLFALMLNTGPGCIKRVAADGTLLHMNPAGLKLIEVCREQDVVGRSVFDLIFPEHRDAFVHMHQDVIGGAARTLQFKVQGLQGTRRWLETHAVPFHNPVTGGTEHLAITYDISERKQAEEALRLSQERLHQALRASNTGLWDWNTESGDVSFSNEWKSQLGFGETELPDSFDTWASRLHPDDRDPAIRYAQAYRDNPVGVFRQDFRLRHKDGSYRWIDSHASFVTEADGRTIRLLGSHTDITARKEVAQALADSEQRFALAVAGANDALWDVRMMPGESWRAPHTPIWWSPRTRLILRLEESEPFDTVAHWAGRLHPDDAARVFDLLAAHMERRVPYDAEYRLRDGRGEYRWIRARGQAIWDEQGNPRRMSGSCKDVTERKIRELLIAAENDLLSMIATDAPLPAILTALCRALEACSPESLCSILLLDRDGIHLRHGAGPGLPDAYVQAIDGVAIGPAVGSCGTAAATKQRIITPDIATDPLWEDYRELALLHGLQACWSVPVLAANGAILGTFAVYHRRPWHPEAVDLELVDRASRLASIAVERAQTEDKLRLTQFSIDHATDALYWIDQYACIVDVNQAACAMLGYSAEEFRRMTVHDINPHFPAASWPGFWTETKQAGTASIQSEHRAKDGRLIPVEVNVRFLLYEGCEYHCAFVRDITERKRAEEELARALHSLQIIMETVPDVIFALDLEGRLSQWNTRMEVVTGYGADELFLKPALDMVPLDEAARTSAAIKEAFEAGYAELEGHLLAKDGRAIPYHWTGAPFTDLDGRVLGITGVGRDVTERKRAEAALRLTRFSIERAVDAVFWIDAQARILDINDAACAVLGYTRDELLSMTVHDIDPNFPAEAWPAHWAELKTRKSFSFETDHRRKDGTVIQTETTVNFLIHEGQEYNCAIMRNISVRKHTEGLLRFNEERFRLVAEATNDILWDWDLVTGGHWWSPNACEKFGYDPNAEPDVRAWTERIHPDDRDRVLALVERALASGATSLSEEYRFRLADGSYGHFYDRGHIVRDASGQARRMIGAMIDVTFSKRAYASLETAYQRLQSMSRELQTVESRERRRLSRELHDEVGQLLTALKFDLEATRRALSDPQAVAVERAHARTLRALETTDELFARLRRVVRALRPPVLEELGLKEAFEALVSDVQSRSDLACSVSVEGEGLVSPADSAIEAAIYRMAQELVTNVVRHAQAMTMSVVLTVDSHYWTLIVQDDGAGFDPKAESISGMGIRGVRERAEILAGRVDFSSTPGAGSTVTVWIPVAVAGLSGEDSRGMRPGGRTGPENA